jgi:heat-inducible transcriptional repressor
MNDPIPVGPLDGSGASGLTERQRMVLSSIVRRYIGNAEPVGSRQVSKDIVDALSPATIRNVMADMEDMGLIDQPHASAGRQPTERGFRMWVDHIMPQSPLSDAERQVVDSTLNQARSEEQLLAAAALALAEVTRQLGVAISPVLDGSRLDRLELVPVREKTLLLVASFGSGLIRSVAVELEEPVERERLTDLVRRVHLTALGRTPAEIQRDLALRASDTSDTNPDDPASDELVRQILHALLDLAHPTRGGDAFLQGAGNVLSQPELGERRNMANLVQLMEDRSQLAQLLQERTGHEGAYITIGSENRLEHLRTLSLVTHNYRIGDAKGTVGVLGPTRMPYGRLVSAVDYIALRLSQG